MAAPTRSNIKYAVYYCVAAISGARTADLEEELFLGLPGMDDKNVHHDGVGLDGSAIVGVAGTLNVWIKYKGGKKTLSKKTLKEKSTLADTIKAVQECFKP